MEMRSTAPSPRPSARCQAHGSRASATMAPMTSQRGQWRGASGGRPGWVGVGVGVDMGMGPILVGQAFAASAAPTTRCRRRGYALGMRADFFERALRGLYSAALYLLLPVTLYHLVW